MKGRCAMRSPSSRLVQVLVMVLGAAQVTAVLAADPPKLASEVYTDPKGYFRIIPPADWTIQEYKSDARGKVDFNWLEAGKKAQLKAIGAANPFVDFDELIQDCKNGMERVRARMGGTFTIETITLFGDKAALIVHSLPMGLHGYQVQFLAAGNYFTLAFSGTDKGIYDKYLPVFKASIETFEALPKTADPAEARKHTLQSKIRLAQLYLQLGRKDWALTAINEGLTIDSKNEELLRLKKQAEGEQK